MDESNTGEPRTERPVATDAHGPEPNRNGSRPAEPTTSTTDATALDIRVALAVFLPVLGPRTVPSITPMDVQAIVDARGSHVSPSTLRRDVAALRAALNAAVDADLIARSPARRVRLSRLRPPERATLGPEELMRLADAVLARYRALVLVGGVLGLRWGEAIGLRVCDIDFMRRTVTVAQVVEGVAGQIRVVAGEAKSTDSLRTVAAPFS